MSGNTSATGGPLRPAATPAPQEDDALVDLLQPVVSAITGLSGALVRPRWQAKPPAQPTKTTDWCALGVSRIERDLNPHLRQQADGTTRLTRQETVEVLVSCYGPNAGRTAAQLQDGFDIAQNREPLWLANVSYISASDIITAPDLLGQEWVMRKDLTLVFRRRVTREYQVLHLLDATDMLNTENTP